MASSARLERLGKLLQADIHALPDRPVSPAPEPEPEPVSNDEVSGGVLLNPSPPQPQPPPVGTPNKQTAFNNANLHIKVAQPVLGENSERRFVWVEGAESSYNPKPESMRQSTGPPRAATTLPATNLQRGELVSARHHFTPIQALAKFPYKFCNKNHMQDIASAFFDQGKFWGREWDFFYVWDIEPTKPLILVRESQVQTLLKEINSHLKLSLRITDQQREEGLVARFPDHPRCLPRYLGRSHSREEYDKMVDNAPSSTFRAAGEASHPPLQPPTLEEFKQLMEESWEVQKAKSKASKAKKQQERLGKVKSNKDQFKRAQRYLGLHPSAEDGHAQLGLPEAIDPSMPVPFAFDQSVVFVCVDVESYEKAHHKITEIGVATLDTRELIGVAPGEDGEKWRALIRARHFRVAEHRHLVNSEYVEGCPERFQFGESTFVPLQEAANHVKTCFQAPFGAHFSNGADDIATLMSRHDFTEKRNIIFLGHDTLGDVRYLQQLGYDLFTVENILEALDTAILYRVWRREQQPTRLGRILAKLDISGWFLHNAGNDAMYTVQAMLAICVRDATMRGSSELDTMRNEERAARFAVALEEAEQRARDEDEGWSDNEVEGDGGAPVPLAANYTSRPLPAQMASHTTPQYDGSFDSGGRGGRGGVASGHPIPSDSYRAGRDQASDGYCRGSDRGGYQGSGRGSMNGQARGSGHGRGRGRGSFNSTPGNVHSDSQVRYYW